MRANLSANYKDYDLERTTHKLFFAQWKEIINSNHKLMHKLQVQTRPAQSRRFYALVTTTVSRQSITLK